MVEKLTIFVHGIVIDAEAIGGDGGGRDGRRGVGEGQPGRIVEGIVEDHRVEDANVLVRTALRVAIGFVDAVDDL